MLTLDRLFPLRPLDGRRPFLVRFLFLGIPCKWRTVAALSQRVHIHHREVQDPRGGRQMFELAIQWRHRGRRRGVVAVTGRTAFLLNCRQLGVGEVHRVAIGGFVSVQKVAGVPRVCQGGHEWWRGVFQLRPIETRKEGMSFDLVHTFVDVSYLSNNSSDW